MKDDVDAAGLPFILVGALCQSTPGQYDDEDNDADDEEVVVLDATETGALETDAGAMGGQ